MNAIAERDKANKELLAKMAMENWGLTVEDLSGTYLSQPHYHEVRAAIAHRMMNVFQIQMDEIARLLNVKTDILNNDYKALMKLSETTKNKTQWKIPK